MISENVRQLFAELPTGVELVAAAKGRTPQEVLEAVEAGVRIIGQNYVQEAQIARQAVGERAKWHFIGHLQKNKVNKAVSLFDMVETLDSMELGREIDRECAKAGKIMPVLIEVNIAKEPQKSGVFPEDAIGLMQGLSALKNIRVQGIMTMGPVVEKAEDIRPFFKKARALFDEISKSAIPGADMRYLSMGMTDTYKIAIEEGANMVRIGTKIFGRRQA